jgi:hypothetical protein
MITDLISPEIESQNPAYKPTGNLFNDSMTGTEQGRDTPKKVTDLSFLKIQYRSPPK